MTESRRRLVGEIDDLAQLLHYVPYIGFYRILGEDLPHLCLARRIPDKPGTTADKRYRIVPSLLQMMHREEWNDMADMERRTCRVDTAVECDRLPVHEVGKPIEIGAVLDESPVDKCLKSLVHQIPLW